MTKTSQPTPFADVEKRIDHLLLDVKGLIQEFQQAGRDDPNLPIAEFLPRVERLAGLLLQASDVTKIIRNDDTSNVLLAKIMAAIVRTS